MWERNCKELKQDLNPRTPLVKEGKAHSTGVGGTPVATVSKSCRHTPTHRDTPKCGDTPTVGTRPQPPGLSTICRWESKARTALDTHRTGGTAPRASASERLRPAPPRGSCQNTAPSSPPGGTPGVSRAGGPWGAPVLGVGWLTFAEECADHEAEGDGGGGKAQQEDQHQRGVAVGEHRHALLHLCGPGSGDKTGTP